MVLSLKSRQRSDVDGWTTRDETKFEEMVMMIMIGVEGESEAMGRSGNSPEGD
jgi:hypothetical protein